MAAQGAGLSEGNHGSMTARPRSTWHSLFTAMGLRGVALGGRFVFVIFATKYMLPDDFGRFGLLAAVAQIIPTLVGLEAYQILLRRILQEPEKAPDSRRFYAVFILGGALISGVLGMLTLIAFGWSASQVGLGALVVMLEHIGMETSRNLINERFPALSVLSVALRTGSWGVALPALFLAGPITAPWTLETVLCFWLGGQVGAVLVGMPIWRLFRPKGSDFEPRRGGVLLLEVVRRSWTWMVFAANLRVLETGGRFVCAWMISEAVAGRFTFISMMASLSYIAQKGIVEPIYYPKLTSLDATEETHREFRRVNFIVILGSTLCSVIGLAASAWINGTVPPARELVAFGLLCLAFAFLSLSQQAHYRLYRWHQDRAIMTTGIISCVAMIAASILATHLWGIAGAAAGMLVGALVLLVLKERAARELTSGPPED